MVSKNILSIINKYNENGIIIAKNDKFYWFNGHRYEYWCAKPKNSSKHAYYKNNLYVLINRISHIYKNGQYEFAWICIVQTMLYNRKTCIYKGNVYEFHNRKLYAYETNQNSTCSEIGNQKPFNGGDFLFGYDNHIYVIGTKNEKMNLSTGIWSYFKSTTFDIENGCFVNDRFYELINFTHYYDPKLDDWVFIN